MGKQSRKKRLLPRSTFMNRDGCLKKQGLGIGGSSPKCPLSRARASFTFKCFPEQTHHFFALEPFTNSFTRKGRGRGECKQSSFSPQFRLSENCDLLQGGRAATAGRGEGRGPLLQCPTLPSAVQIGQILAHAHRKHFWNFSKLPSGAGDICGR